MARQLPDGTLVEVLPDGTTRPLPDRTDWAALDTLTEEELVAAALSDPDAKPIVEGRTGNAIRGPFPRLIRMRLRLSQEEFSRQYHIPLDQLRDWESHKSEPDSIAKAYLKAILANPETVAKAVAPKPRAAE